ncbi:MAG: hypothetical protein CMC08_01755 [Flavobacteriaceae bacterium]|nr:hypothetical protein [Flavobacteriaceae bacterium]
MRKITFLLLFVSLSIYAQQPVSLFKQFNGAFDFSVFGNTLNESDNSVFNTCTILTTSSAQFTLQPQFTLAAAYLYWAGSGTGDMQVKLNGADVSAQRTFMVSNNGRAYFSAFAEVTPLVAANTSGSFTVSELDIDITGYCDSQTNFGGWSIVVVYEDPAFSIKRQVSIFDGFQFVDQDRPLEITLNFLSITDPQNSKIGFLSWEGDLGLAVTEQLQVNGNVLSDPPLNPADNVFNGTNAYTGSNELYNMDLDFFNIQPYINAGDTNANIVLTSGQDFVIVNNIVAAYNSEIDVDAVIELTNITNCGTRGLTIDYEVTNQGTLGLLSSEVPIAFYIGNQLIAQAKTRNFLPSSASETGSITLNVPQGLPNSASIRAVVDDDGSGMGIIEENDETNNEASAAYQLPDAPQPVLFEVCDVYEENDGIAQVNLSDPELANLLLAGQDPNDFTILYFPSVDDASQNTNALSSPYINTSNPESIFARIQRNGTDCFLINEVILGINLLPEFTLEPSYRLCVNFRDTPIPQESGAPSPPRIDTGLDPRRYAFEWRLDGTLLPNETAPELIAEKGGVYEVTVAENRTGCFSTKLTEVTVSSPPFNAVAEVTSNAFADTHTIEVINEGYGDYLYQLDNGIFQQEPIFTDVLPGTHSVTITDVNGCGTVFLGDIVVIDYPRFVTPNGDGFNDTWNIDNISVLSPDAQIYIFDRFGKLIRELDPNGPGWDGTYNGNHLPSSDYWFRINYTEDNTAKEYRGHFTLKR